jgi:hypothetical protein
MERDEQADRLERDAERMEQESERVGGHIEEARRDWEAKQSDASIAGAQPDPGGDEEDVAGIETEQGERGGMTVEQERQESDQLPEEGPAGQTPEDTDEGARDEAERTPGVPGEEERGTGQEHEREEHGEQ